MVEKGAEIVPAKARLAFYLSALGAGQHNFHRGLEASERHRRTHRQPDADEHNSSRQANRYRSPLIRNSCRSLPE